MLTVLTIALGLLAGLGFIAVLWAARHVRACESVRVWCGGRRRIGVRLPDGSIDCPCGTHLTAAQATTTGGHRA